ncbi:MAG TPA: hypothetical protein VGM44_03200, partial [Polyangiaceae bacterium]
MNLQAAIRSLLGIALTLVAISLASLWACATYESRTHVLNDPFASLPLFFNRAPVGIAELAQVAMRSVSRGGADAARANRELARLGGAALPYVLPALDSLDPESRVRVALALTPVAERMEVGNRDDFASGDQAVLFWTRFWQDRAIDFRAPAVRHSTARLAEREVALRREDLIHVDTFALPSLIEALGEVKAPSDIDRIERLDSVLAHVTNRSPTLGPGASTDEAARAAEAWRDFWDLHGSEYTALDGPRRL